jgi:hypothetical protein
VNQLEQILVIYEIMFCRLHICESAEAIHFQQIGAAAGQPYPDNDRFIL